MSAEYFGCNLVQTPLNYCFSSAENWLYIQSTLSMEIVPPQLFYKLCLCVFRKVVPREKHGLWFVHGVSLIDRGVSLIDLGVSLIDLGVSLIYLGVSLIDLGVSLNDSDSIVMFLLKRNK